MWKLWWKSIVDKERNIRREYFENRSLTSIKTNRSARGLGTFVFGAAYQPARSSPWRSPRYHYVSDVRASRQQPVLLRAGASSYRRRAYPTRSRKLTVPRVYQRQFSASIAIIGPRLSLTLALSSAQCVAYLDGNRVRPPPFFRRVVSKRDVTLPPYYLLGTRPRHIPRIVESDYTSRLPEIIRSRRRLPWFARVYRSGGFRSECKMYCDSRAMDVGSAVQECRAIIWWIIFAMLITASVVQRKSAGRSERRWRPGRHRATAEQLSGKYLIYLLDLLIWK